MVCGMLNVKMGIRKIAPQKIAPYENTPLWICLLWKLSHVKISSQKFAPEKISPWENYPEWNPLPTSKSYKWKKKQNYKSFCL